MTDDVTGSYDVILKTSWRLKCFSLWNASSPRVLIGIRRSFNIMVSYIVCLEGPHRSWRGDISSEVMKSSHFRLNISKTVGDSGLFPIGRLQESVQGQSNGDVSDDVTWLWRQRRDITTSKCFFFDNSCRNWTIFSHNHLLRRASTFYKDSRSRRYDVCSRREVVLFQPRYLKNCWDSGFFPIGSIYESGHMQSIGDVIDDVTWHCDVIVVRSQCSKCFVNSSYLIRWSFNTTWYGMT